MTFVYNLHGCKGQMDLCLHTFEYPKVKDIINHLADSFYLKANQVRFYSPATEKFWTPMRWHPPVIFNMK